MFDKSNNIIGNAVKKICSRRMKNNIRVLIVYIYYLFKRNSASLCEYKKAANFMLKHGITMYPSDFSLKYKDLYKNTSVFKEKNGMKFIFHGKNKLYFPANMENLKISKLYQSLVTEQDNASPHVYEYQNHKLRKNSIVLDIGAAEGIFVLDHIDDIKHAYLFECDENWIESLQMTFAPWKDKITIIPKYVSNEITNVSTTIDAFVGTYSIKIDFIKMDIEGSEINALEGARECLLNQNVMLSVCAYHKLEHAKEIAKILSEVGYNVTNSGRIMYLGDINPPTFRIGVLYANK